MIFSTYFAFVDSRTPEGELTLGGGIFCGTSLEAALATARDVFARDREDFQWLDGAGVAIDDLISEAVARQACAGRDIVIRHAVRDSNLLITQVIEERLGRG